MTDKHVACFVLYDVLKHAALMENRPEYNDGREYWVYPGGKLEDGESAYDAMVREMRQEIGCTPLDTGCEQLAEPILAVNGWTCTGFLVTAWWPIFVPPRVLDTGAPLAWINPFAIACEPTGSTARRHLARRTCMRLLEL